MGPYERLQIGSQLARSDSRASARLIKAETLIENADAKSAKVLSVALLVPRSS